jgi:hypothetical protein
MRHTQKLKVLLKWLTPAHHSFGSAADTKPSQQTVSAEGDALRPNRLLSF